MDYFWEVDISDVYFWSSHTTHEDVKEGREPDTSGPKIQYTCRKKKYFCL